MQPVGYNRHMSNLPEGLSPGEIVSRHAAKLAESLRKDTITDIIYANLRDSYPDAQVSVHFDENEFQYLIRVRVVQDGNVYGVASAVDYDQLTQMYSFEDHINDVGRTMLKRLWKEVPPKAPNFSSIKSVTSSVTNFSQATIQASIKVKQMEQAMYSLEEHTARRSVMDAITKRANPEK